MFAVASSRWVLLLVCVIYVKAAFAQREPGIQRSVGSENTVVAHWRLMQSSQTGERLAAAHKDVSGNGHDAQLIGGPAFRELPYDVGGSVLTFDGGQTRAFVADAPAFHLTKSLTLEAYISVDHYPTDADMAQIVFRGDDRPGNDPWFLALTSKGQLRFAITDAENQSSVLETQLTLPLGPLLHVAATLDDETGLQTIWINHHVAARTTTDIRAAGPLTGARPGIGIGNWAKYSRQAFAGTIHNLRISRIALRPSQLQAATIQSRGERASVKKPADESITLVAGVRLFHNVRLDRLNRGASVSVGQGRHEFVDVRAPLKGLYFTNRDPYQGATRFSVLQNQTVYAAFYGQDWREGGNDSGNWRHELNSPEQLTAMGWREVGKLRVRHTNPKLGEQPSWIVYARHCRRGETITLRNHKYKAPLLIWGTTETPASGSGEKADSGGGSRGDGGFGPFGFGQ